MRLASERSASMGTGLVSRRPHVWRPSVGTDGLTSALFPRRVIQSARELAASSSPRADSGATRATELDELASGFDSEGKCRAYLERLRWPTGVRCPRCDTARHISRIETRGQFDCRSCGYQFSVRAGTLLHASHVPLWKWFLAAYVMGGSGDQVSAHRLEELLGVSYKTAWFLRHRIRRAMKGGTSRSRAYLGDILRRLINTDTAPDMEIVATA